MKMDVTGLTDAQVASLVGALSAQCEAFEDDLYGADREDLSYPDVPVLDVSVA